MCCTWKFSDGPREGTHTSAFREQAGLGVGCWGPMRNASSSEGYGELHQKNEQSLPSTGQQVYHRVGANRPRFQEGIMNLGWYTEKWCQRDHSFCVISSQCFALKLAKRHSLQYHYFAKVKGASVSPTFVPVMEFWPFCTVMISVYVCVPRSHLPDGAGDP